MWKKKEKDEMILHWGWSVINNKQIGIDYEPWMKAYKDGVKVHVAEELLEEEQHKDGVMVVVLMKE